MTLPGSVNLPLIILRHPRISVVLLFSILCFGQVDATPSPADALIGLWGAEQAMGPKVQGVLTISTSGSEWHAKNAGLETSVQNKNGAISFVLPESAGEFRVHISPDSETLFGLWIQPTSNVYNNRYATPVQLSKKTAGIWTGKVAPLEEKLSF